MDDLTAFLTAQLNEYEQVAVVSNDPDNTSLLVRVLDDDVKHPIYIGAGLLLRQINAHRRILEEHDDDGSGNCSGCGCDHYEMPLYTVDECPTKRILATAHDDHPDYQEKWRP